MVDFQSELLIMNAIIIVPVVLEYPTPHIVLRPNSVRTDICIIKDECKYRTHTTPF